MKAKLLRDVPLSQLRNSVADNLSHYRVGSFTYLEMDQSLTIELPVDLNEGALTELKMPSGGNDFEVENCLAVHKYLEKLSPYDARDERLWTFIAHTSLLEYSRKRWPIPDDNEKAIAHIEQHFFAGTNRQIERDNAVSRLWWMTHLCTRVKGVDLEEALVAFLFRSDVRANIIERPTIAQSTNVFAVILRALIKSFAAQKNLFERQTFRKLMIELNSIGGFKLLDALPESELKKIFADVVTNRLSISSL